MIKILNDTPLIKKALEPSNINYMNYSISKGKLLRRRIVRQFLMTLVVAVIFIIFVGIKRIPTEYDELFSDRIKCANIYLIFNVKEFSTPKDLTVFRLMAIGDKKVVQNHASSIGMY